MNKNFKVRFSVSILLLIIAAVFLFTFNSIPFKIFFGTFAFVASFELFSFFSNFRTKSAKPAKRNNFPLCIIFSLIEIACLIASTIFIAKQDALTIVVIILGVCGYDVFAYLFGSWLGGKIFKKSRPFPFVSKNKTWEGTILGLLTALILVVFTSFFACITGPGDANEYHLCHTTILWLCPLLALIGDLFESLLKRFFNIKDSNENVIKYPLFTKLELLVGGSEGHGGYLDRIDSLAFTATMLLLLSCIL